MWIQYETIIIKINEKGNWGSGRQGLYNKILDCLKRWQNIY